MRTTSYNQFDWGKTSGDYYRTWGWFSLWFVKGLSLDNFLGKWMQMLSIFYVVYWVVLSYIMDDKHQNRPSLCFLFFFWDDELSCSMSLWVHIFSTSLNCLVSFSLVENDERVCVKVTCELEFRRPVLSIVILSSSWNIYGALHYQVESTKNGRH